MRIPTIALPHYARRWILLYVMSGFAGVAGGLGAVLFRLMIDGVRWLFFHVLLPYFPLDSGGLSFGVILLPAIGGLIVGPITMRLAPQTRGAGIPEVMESVAVHKSRLSYWTALLKISVSSVTIGSGGSAGREGPIALIGGAMGSIFGRVLKLSPQGTELLVVCGVSAGIAGTYNAPLGGAVFGIEILLRRIDLTRAVPVLMSSVIGASVAAYFLGASPSFSYTGAKVWDPSELIFYIVLGLVFGLLSVFWVKIFYWTVDLFHRLPGPSFFKPAAGGLLTGILIVSFPGYGVGGVGYDGIDLILAGKLTFDLLLLLGALKLLATCFTIGSGGSGGIFAPTLYIGGMFGGAFGWLFHSLSPSLVQDPFKYALAGMAALFAGATQAPINIMIMIPEMSRDLGLIPPIMASSVSSFFISWLFLHGSSIYTLKLQRRGLDLRMGRSFTLGLVKVEEIMIQGAEEIGPETPVGHLDDLFEKYRLTRYPVVVEGRLIGSATLKDLSRIPHRARDDVRIREILSADQSLIHPDEGILEALDRMEKENADMLCVVDRDDPEGLLGILTRYDALQAFERYAKGPFE